jgi:hypothetical protein
MLRRVALIRADVSEDRSASIIRVTRIGELGITLAVTNNRLTLRRNSISSRQHSSNLFLLIFMYLVEKFVLIKSQRMFSSSEYFKVHVLPRNLPGWAKEAQNFLEYFISGKEL